ncbi:MAG: OsmC family protein [Anaerolineales bacterium]|nr:OsmC family protein [Anaerolineales bacterium]
MHASVKWNSRMSFTGIADSGFPISLDTDESVGGDNCAARPLELIALGLAGCTAMDVISILQKKRQAVTSFEVKVDVARANEHPKVFTNAVIHYVITGRNIDEAALTRAIELSAVKYCPAQAMLAKAFPMELRYEIYEDGPQPKLVKEAVLELPKK